MRKRPHRVYMAFQTHTGWCCQFLEEDLKTPLPTKLKLIGQEKIFEIAERGGQKMNLETRQAIQQAIEKGRGGIWLDLTEEQHRRLKENS